MTGKSHLTIGIVTYASLWVQPIGPLHAPLLGGSRALIALPVALAIVAFGSLLPDIDHPDSSLANEKVIGIPIFRPLAIVMEKLFTHRGATHSLAAVALLLALGNLTQLPWDAWLAAARAAIGLPLADQWRAAGAGGLLDALEIVGAVAYGALRLLGLALRLLWAEWNVGWLLAWGFLAHLAADALTRSGIPLFWPLPSRFGFPPIRALRFTTDTPPEYIVLVAIVGACVVNVLRAAPA